MTIVVLGRTRDENDRLIQLAMVCMCTGILAADVLIPLGFVIWILYLIPLLMSVWLSYRYSPFFTAWVVSGAILIGSFMTARTDPSDLPNRAIFILITAIIALLIHEIQTSYASLEKEIAERTIAQENLEDLTLTLEKRVADRTLELSKVNEALTNDNAERRKVETTLFVANQKLNLLSGITRHDILNRVCALLLELDFVRELIQDSQVREHMDAMGRLAVSIQEQIAFTKDYQEIGVMAPLWHDIASVVRNSAAQFNAPEVHFDITLEGVEVYADPLITKVIYNLIDNALRHGRHVTRIGFSYQPSGKGLVIICEDNGVGISYDDKRHLFIRGFGKNSGLGLFLIREILAITGTTIVETGEPGKGARFELTWPVGQYRILPAAS
jgi:signal transduction histidine kinase